MTFPNARSLVYRYLLGELAEAENREVEEKVRVDDDYRERLRETEPRLIAAYIVGDLSVDKGESFDKYFLRFEERLKKFRLAESLYEYIKPEVNRSLNANDHLRRYLLGELAEAENREVEEKARVDDDYRKQLEVAEHKLIGAYIFGDLSVDKRERFEKYFLRSKERVESLRFAEAICEYYQYVECVESREGASVWWVNRLQQWLTKSIGLSARFPGHRERPFRCNVN